MPVKISLFKMRPGPDFGEKKVVEKQPINGIMEVQVVHDLQTIDVDDPDHWSSVMRCTICLEFLNDPYLLPCGHSFCFK